MLSLDWVGTYVWAVPFGDVAPNPRRATTQRILIKQTRLSFMSLDTVVLGGQFEETRADEPVACRHQSDRPWRPDPSPRLDTREKPVQRRQSRNAGDDGRDIVGPVCSLLANHPGDMVALVGRRQKNSKQGSATKQTVASSITTLIANKIT